jgi:nucleoside-diphosphate-sugar epimerase
MKIDLTGKKGFLLKSLLKYFNNNSKHEINLLNLRDKNILNNCLNSDVCIHLAGIAHDTKNSIQQDLYYNINTFLTKNLFDNFLQSKCKVFIFISSVKAVADSCNEIIYEDHIPNPKSIYGKSKLLAENYILQKKLPAGKRVYILRPCMIHGNDNKGNLNNLYNFVKVGLPWPLGSFHSSRSFCSIENFCFIINEFIENVNIASGVYNIADDETIETNKIIELMFISRNKNIVIWRVPRFIIKKLALLGDLFNFPLNTESLEKLTQSYIVSNKKLKKAINKPLPLKSLDGMKLTIDSFK